jgi:23S rRNA (cytidine2498-2'-O)-methyltransferase
MHTAPAFLFVTCQVGAEAAVKGEIARRWPLFRFAYSRPGFLTFKLPEGHGLPDDLDLESVFARAYGFSLGKVTGETEDQIAQAAWKLAAAALPATGPTKTAAIEKLHVWQRDARAAGDHGYAPGLSLAALSARAALLRTMPMTVRDRLRDETPTAQPGQLVLDCVLVQANEWWLGYHRARRGPSCLSGGLDDLALPEAAVSRTWLKTEEALRWSGLPLAAGDHCVEIGCAPGGSCQALLSRGLIVMGVDPADVDAVVLADPRFTHARKRGADMRRREFRDTDWLLADMNVAPAYTLDTVEAIVTHAEVHIRGLLLTLKLLAWRMAADVPDYLDRVRSWGYPHAIARQLQHCRQEICVAAWHEMPKGKMAKKRSRRRLRSGGTP